MMKLAPPAIDNMCQKQMSSAIKEGKDEYSGSDPLSTAFKLTV